MRATRVTSTRPPKSSSPSNELLFGLLFADLLHHENFDATEFLLKAVSEIVRAIFEKDDEAECEKHEKSDPEDPAQQRHDVSLTEALF